MVITSAQNALFKRVKSLNTKKYREKEGVLLLEGIRMVEHALKLGLPIEGIFVNETSQWQAPSDMTVTTFSEALFDQLTDTIHSQGVMAMISQAALMQNEDLDDKVVVLDQLQDPGNLGTIIRTCDAFGYHTLYLTKGCVDPYAPKVLRATMGSIFNVKLYTGWDPQALIDHLKACDYTLLVTSLHDSVPLKEVVVDGPRALCFGNEGNGISQPFLWAADHLVHIPMQGSAESLNVGIACGIALYAFS